MNNDNLDRVIREKERLYLTGVPPASWWRLEKAGLAPKGRSQDAINASPRGSSFD